MTVTDQPAAVEEDDPPADVLRYKRNLSGHHTGDPRRCLKCRRWLLPPDAEETSSAAPAARDSSQSAGVSPQCRRCCAARIRANYAADPEPVRARARARYAADPEATNVRNRAWRAANPEAARASVRAWRVAHPEAVRAYARAWRAANLETVRARVRARYAANPDAVRSYARAWRAANLEAVRASSRATLAARAARTDDEIAAARTRLRPDGLKRCRKCHERLPLVEFATNPTKPDGLATECRACVDHGSLRPRMAAYWSEVAQPHWIKRVCYICLGPLGNDWHVEHIVPRAAGGGDHVGNLLPACATCNLSKHTRNVADILLERNPYAHPGDPAIEPIRQLAAAAADPRALVQAIERLDPVNATAPEGDH